MKQLTQKPLFNSQRLKDERGFAVVESVTMIIVFLTLFWYTIGFWGVIHTGNLHAIASRNYAFEVYRHRSNLWYFRGNTMADLKYHNMSSRLHGTNNEDSPDGKQYATERRVAMFHENEPQGRSSQDHNRTNQEINVGTRNTGLSLDPVWIKVQYGLCLTMQCGDN